MINKFKNNWSIVSIKSTFPSTVELNVKAVTVNQINQIIINLDVVKATGTFPSI